MLSVRVGWCCCPVVRLWARIHMSIYGNCLRSSLYVPNEPHWRVVQKNGYPNIEYINTAVRARCAKRSERELTHTRVVRDNTCHLRA